MDKIVGTINVLGDEILSMKVKVRVGIRGQFKVTDIQVQEGNKTTQYNRPSFEEKTDIQKNKHYNFINRGIGTVIVPYASNIPKDTLGKTLPEETDYITTPIKLDIMLHNNFNQNSNTLIISPGISSQGKEIKLIKDVYKFTNICYNGFTSEQSVNDTVTYDPILEGRELRLPNADAKYTIDTDGHVKVSGTLSAKETIRIKEV